MPRTQIGCDKAFKVKSIGFHTKCNTSRGKKEGKVPGYRLNYLLEKKKCPADLEDDVEYQVCSFVLEHLKNNRIPKKKTDAETTSKRRLEQCPKKLQITCRHNDK